MSHTTELELIILNNMINRMPVYMSLCQYTSDVFDNPDLGLWFDAIRDCYSSTGNCDIMAVMAALQKEGRVDVFQKWMDKISTAPIAVATIEQHIGTFVKMYQKRLLDRASYKAIESPTPDKAISHLEEGLSMCVIGGKDSGSSVKDMAATDITSLVSADDLVTTGFLPLDQAIYGFGKGELVVIGGYSKHGKTTFAVQCAAEMSRDMGVHYYSLEMSGTEVYKKILSRKASVPTSNMYEGKLSPAEKSRLETATEILKSGSHDLKIIDDIYNIDEILTHARLANIRKGVKAIFIDYLQLCKSNVERGTQRYVIVGDITRKMKMFAQQTGVRVIALSQMNGDENERPNLNNFRESGNIAQDCNIPMIVWHDKKEQKSLLIVDRNRRTAPMDIDIVFEGAFSRFRDGKPASHNWNEAERP